MEPSEYLRAVKRRWFTILVLTVLGAVAGLSIALTIPSTYEASTSVFVSADQNDSNSQALYTGNQYSQAVVQSYVQLATLPAVLQPVIDGQHLDTTPAKLAHQVTATAALDTVIIQITATDTVPDRARAVAQGTAESLVTQAQSLAPKVKGKPTVSMRIVARATTPTSAVGPSRLLFTALGLVAGLAIGLVYAFARSLLGTRILDDEDLERTTDVPLLGRIGQVSRRHGAGAIMRNAPYSTVAEEYRRLRTNLEFANVDDPVRTLVVTSGLPGEGKSTTALNLALALAEQGHRTILIDGDLRRPSVADYTGLDGGVGLTTVLRGQTSIEDAVQPLGDSGLRVMPAGAVPPNPNQLVGSDAMAALVQRLGETYDFVIIDAPPVLLVTDALILTGLSDGAIVVAQSASTKRPDLARTLEALELVNERALGVVLNRARSAAKSTYYGYDEGTDGGTRTAVAASRTPAETRAEARGPVSSNVR